MTSGVTHKYVDYLLWINNMVGFPLVFAASLASSKVTHETLSDVQPWDDAAQTADKRTPNEIFILKFILYLSLDQLDMGSPTLISEQ